MLCLPPSRFAHLARLRATGQEPDETHQTTSLNEIRFTGIKKRTAKQVATNPHVFWGGLWCGRGPCVQRALPLLVAAAVENSFCGRERGRAGEPCFPTFANTKVQSSLSNSPTSPQSRKLPRPGDDEVACNVTVTPHVGLTKSHVGGHVFIFFNGFSLSCCGMFASWKKSRAASDAFTPVLIYQPTYPKDFWASVLRRYHDRKAGVRVGQLACCNRGRVRFEWLHAGGRSPMSRPTGEQ